MKKIKIFPAPHVEIRIHVTEEMEKDMRECARKPCIDCSWNRVIIGRKRMCLDSDVKNQVLRGIEL